LNKGAYLVVACTEEATLGTDAVVVDEAGEQLGYLVAGEVAVGDLEEAFAGDGAEVGDVAADATGPRSAKFLILTFTS
jgi:hypothetical protein